VSVSTLGLVDGTVIEVLVSELVPRAYLNISSTPSILYTVSKKWDVGIRISNNERIIPVAVKKLMSKTVDFSFS